MTRVAFIKFAKKKRRAIHRRERQIIRLKAEIAHAQKHVKEPVRRLDIRNKEPKR